MGKPKVFVTRLMPGPALDQVRAACEADIWEGELPPAREILLEKVRGKDGILSLLTDRMDGEMMDTAGPQLKVISNYAVGYDNIDLPAAKARGILVGNTPGILTDATADCAFSLMMAAGRRIAEGDRYVRAGKWQTWGPSLLLGADFHGATLGIVGFGRIGRAVARRASGFEMRILFHDPMIRDEEIDGACNVSLETLLREADFVSVHTPLTAETRHLIGKKSFERMKSSAVLVNTSRGAVVDMAALAEALQTGKIFAAGLDVTDPEPINMDSPLLKLENCLIVPHIASASRTTREKMATMAAANLLAGVRGEPLPTPVN